MDCLLRSLSIKSWSVPNALRLDLACSACAMAPAGSRSAEKQVVCGFEQLLRTSQVSLEKQNSRQNWPWDERPAKGQNPDGRCTWCTSEWLAGTAGEAQECLGFEFNWNRRCARHTLGHQLTMTGRLAMQDMAGRLCAFRSCHMCETCQRTFCPWAYVFSVLWDIQIDTCLFWLLDCKTLPATLCLLRLVRTPCPLALWPHQAHPNSKRWRDASQFKLPVTMSLQHRSEHGHQKQVQSVDTRKCSAKLPHLETRTPYLS